MTRWFIVLWALCGAPVALAAGLQADFIAASTAALKNPHDLKLSLDGKYLFVADVDNNRVAVLDPKTLKLIGQFGADHQSGTHDIDIDAAGRAYVADTYNDWVLIYKMNGAAAKRVGQLVARIGAPEGVLAHSNGRIYVTGARSGNVVAYKDGAVVAERKRLSAPHDVAQAPNGDIWLADAGNDRLLVLSPDLSVKRVLKGAPYHFNGVRYLDVLPDGVVIAADKNNHQVKFIGPDGALLLTLGTGRPGRGPGVFTTPEGVETRGDTIWLSDSGNDRVVKYRIRRQ
jgi:DNA-binding beta-propeller fold protein YncE